jgi:threonyl-tRNA synthetase
MAALTGSVSAICGRRKRIMALRPMSCPCHVQVFNKGLRSWRELPVRYAEFGACHRYEPSSSPAGLMSTRAFKREDAPRVLPRGMHCVRGQSLRFTNESC